MKNQGNKIKALRNANALSIFLVLMVICLLVGYVLLFLNDKYGFDGKEPLTMDKYEIVVSINDTTTSGVKYFNSYKEYSVSDANTFLGNLTETKSDEAKENLYSLKFDSIGTYSEENGFKLNGALLLSAGDVIKINNGHSEFYAEVISIIKIDG